MTQFLFREDAYLRDASATVLSADPESGIILDRTIFYATSGGQPADVGTLRRDNGDALEIKGAIHPDGDKSAIAHLVEGPLPAPGETVQLSIDWDRRHRLMRMHSALHLLSVVFPFAVTGGSVGEDKGRLDFDMPEVPENIAALEDQLNAWVQQDHPIRFEWITDSEMAAQPDLIKTMKVKPPMGQGKVRLVRIGDIDLQPCGGTHVRSTAEIGALRIGKIEKKGRENRRVNLHFA